MARRAVGDVIRALSAFAGFAGGFVEASVFNWFETSERRWVRRGQKSVFWVTLMFGAFGAYMAFSGKPL